MARRVHRYDSSLEARTHLSTVDPESTDLVPLALDGVLTEAV
jgi:hypothetical protein